MIKDAIRLVLEPGGRQVLRISLRASFEQHIPCHQFSSSVRIGAGCSRA